MKTIQATDLRMKTREILDGAHWQGEIYQVTTFGHPVAVILPVAEYERLVNAAGISMELPTPSLAIAEQ